MIVFKEHGNIIPTRASGEVIIFLPMKTETN